MIGVESRDRRVRIGVAGAGSMGSNHIRVLSELPGVFDFAGVYDPVPERARIAEQYGVRSYSTYDEMLKDVEAVTLPCPTSLHKEMALLAAESGVHALVEKPAAENTNDTREMVGAFSKKGLTFTVGHIERFNPVVRTLTDIVKQTPIVAVEIHRCSPFDTRIYDADVVADLMVHDIDIVIHSIIGDTPDQVEAYGMKVYGNRFVDFAHAAVTFPGGTLAFITASRCTEDKIRTVTIHTQGALIEGDLFRRTLTIKRGVQYDERTTNPHIDYRQSSTMEQIALPNVEPLKEELLDFGKSILSGARPTVEGEQVIRTMSVLDRVEWKLYGKGGDF